mgnify:CR=1 FL=1
MLAFVNGESSMSTKQQPSTPVFGILYGPPKTGKTLATLRAFAGSGLFLAPRGGLSCQSYIDCTPKEVTVRTVDDVMQVLSQPSKLEKYSAVIIDDFSVIADAELTALRKKYRVVWDAYAALADKVCELRDLARNLPCHVFLTMHEQPPREVSKAGGTVFIPGSPAIGGHKLPEKLPALVDFVARITHNPDYGGWPYVYQVAPDENYITGDRLSICPGVFALNLREMLLAAGYTINRPKELAWMEDVIEKLYPLILEEMKKEDPEYRPLLARAAAKLEDKNWKHVRWALMDSFDRARLALHDTNSLSKFIDSFETVEL